MDELGQKAPEEEAQAALAFQQAKETANLEYARRIREGEDGFDKLGHEALPEVELKGVYENSAIAGKIEKRRELGLSPVALFSDIDNTFYKKGMVETTNRLNQVLGKNDWGLIYVTGRDFPGVEQQTDLPKADVVVGAVGTEIFVRQKDDSYTADEDYRNLLLGTWNREKIYGTAQQLVEENSDLVFQERDVPGAYESGKVDQPPQEFKISFNIFGNTETAHRISQLIEDEIEGAKVVLSQDINDPNRWNVDLLPISAGKELAVRYLTEKLGIRGIVGGDSGNDLSMLVEGGHPAILVGGSHEHVKAEILQFEPAASTGMQMRELPNGKRVAFGRDSIDTAAQGLINVLQQGDFNPEDAKWFVQSLYEVSKQEEG